METGVRKLPIGIQNFENIRRRDFVYVDKTAFVYEMATMGIPYFLSRPRRFGKSLLLSTFEAYFEGKKELFKGLAIERLESEWLQYPVLHLDLNAEKYTSPERLEYILSNNLTQWEELYGKGEDEKTLPARFMGVIRRANEKTGMQVVVLVDEYDKPLLQALNNEELLGAYRDTLKSFYGVLKSADRYLRFVFLTGVTKFAHVSVFSDLNQLSDISMVPRFSQICGITFEELKNNFEPEIKALAETNSLSYEGALDRLERMYDGYHFSENTVGIFNPFSVLNALQYSRFDSYWFQTGTPTFLVDVLKKSEYDLRTLIDGVEAPSSVFTEYRVEVMNPVPLLYQSGYLTLKEFDDRFRLYRLGFPNEEVKYGFLSFIAPFYTAVTDDEKGFYVGKFVQELETCNVDAFMNRLQAFFADFPYELNAKTERHYQVVFYIVFKLMGQFCDVEVRSAKGRADAVVKTADYIYVFEFKLDGTVEEALRQIDEKGYLIPYQSEGRQLVKVGASFSKEERNIADWKIQMS
ncbi:MULTISPECIES: ATP-binding protein [unclassified Parabacteroides]|uniref:ATP-binding protein n=1 Tax=unclassified Parabacteroides TaxID=2649774 RepID=UPI000EFF9296|nr:MULTISPECIES: ATP-binding protein [unclassified Parabacteroides]RHO70092.1 AAA family ATPase [Parabacteroides sp. AF48-14]RHR59577.1 AAA family ATPase [Parabacteroides sp. AF17-28]